MKNNNIDGFSFVLQATLVSFVLANNLDPAEQELLGNFLQSVGANLSNIATLAIAEELEGNATTSNTTNTI